MIARVATFNALPDGVNDGAVDLLRQTVRESRATWPNFTCVTRRRTTRCR